MKVFPALLTLVFTGIPFVPSAALANDTTGYYTNGRWFTVENTAYYLRLDEWRKIRGRCYRLRSNHTIEEQPAKPGPANGLLICS